MILDSSALIAVILEEPDAMACSEKLSSARSLSISAATLTETSIVLLARAGQIKLNILDELLATLQVEVVPFSKRQALMAREAYDRYGKGRHKANLNLGDCFTYALAKDSGEPLLFIGKDFIHTDLARA